MVHFSAELIWGTQNVSTPETAPQAIWVKHLRIRMREFRRSSRRHGPLRRNVLKSGGHISLSHHNEILQAAAITRGRRIVLVASLGSAALPWIPAAPWPRPGSLTLVNYIGTMDLLRNGWKWGRY
jgi:hypothetical protein